MENRNPTPEEIRETLRDSIKKRTWLVRVGYKTGAVKIWIEPRTAMDPRSFYFYQRVRVYHPLVWIVIFLQFFVSIWELGVKQTLKDLWSALKENKTSQLTMYVKSKS